MSRWRPLVQHPRPLADGQSDPWAVFDGVLEYRARPSKAIAGALVADLHNFYKVEKWTRVPPATATAWVDRAGRGLPEVGAPLAPGKRRYGVRRGAKNAWRIRRQVFCRGGAVGRHGTPPANWYPTQGAPLAHICAPAAVASWPHTEVQVPLL